MENIQVKGFKVLEKIGVGGMATVYKAIQLKLDRVVVLKIMDSSLLKDESFKQRFLREAKISAQLSHRNIIQIYDVECDNDLCYLSMEYVDGGDLFDLLKQPIKLDLVVRLAGDLCSALAFAHSRNIIHRDVKSRNILIKDNGSFLLADFGIAKAADLGTQMTIVGSIVGSPKYMSPEQANGSEIDGRSDFYSLAIVLFEVLTGNVPYIADSSISIALKHLNDEIPILPKDLEHFQPFFTKALAKSPIDRFQDGKEFFSAFSACCSDVDGETIIFNQQEMEDRLSDISQSKFYSQANSKPPSKNKLNILFKPYMVFTVILAIILFFSFNYFSESSEQQKLVINQKLSSAYKALRSNKMEEALISFKEVINIDESNQMAITSTKQVKTIFIEDIKTLLKVDKFNTAKLKVAKLNHLYDDDNEIIELTNIIDKALADKQLLNNKNDQIQQLKLKASLALNKGNFLTPKIESAAYYFSELKKIANNDKLIDRHMAELAIDSESKIHQLIQRGLFDLARIELEQFKYYFGSNSSLSILEDKLEEKHESILAVKQKAENYKRQQLSAINELKSRIDEISDTTESIQYKFELISLYLELKALTDDTLQYIPKMIKTVNSLNVYFNNEYKAKRQLITPSILNKIETLENDKELSKSINKLLSTLSSKENLFEKSANMLAQARVKKDEQGLSSQSLLKRYLVLEEVDTLGMHVEQARQEKNKIEAEIFNNANLHFNTKNLSKSKSDIKILNKISSLNTNDLEGKIKLLEAQHNNNTKKQSSLTAKAKMLETKRLLFTPKGNNAFEFYLKALNIRTSMNSKIEMKVHTLYKTTLKSIKKDIELHNFNRAQTFLKQISNAFISLPPETSTYDLHKLYEKELKSEQKKISDRKERFDDIYSSVNSSIKEKNYALAIDQFQKLLIISSGMAEFERTTDVLKNQLIFKVIDETNRLVNDKDFKKAEILILKAEDKFENKQIVKLRKKIAKLIAKEDVSIIGF